MSYSGYTDSIVLFGDSITESWAPGSLAQRMSERYSRILDVVNRGFGGYNSRWAIPVLHQIFATKKQREAGQAQAVKLMTIWFGTNDAVRAGEPQYVPVEEYKQNLEQLISLIRDPTSELYSPDTKLILLTPGPMIDTGNPGRSVERPLIYATACQEVADRAKVPLVHVYDAMVTAAGGDTPEKLAPFFYDGLHFTAEGYDVVFERLMQVISESYPDLHPDQLSRRMPEYSAVALDYQGELEKALQARQRSHT